MACGPFDAAEALPLDEKRAICAQLAERAEAAHPPGAPDRAVLAELVVEALHWTHPERLTGTLSTEHLVTGLRLFAGPEMADIDLPAERLLIEVPFDPDCTEAVEGQMTCAVRVLFVRDREELYLSPQEALRKRLTGSTGPVRGADLVITLERSGSRWVSPDLVFRLVQAMEGAERSD